ncbi:hypothetical protein BDV12DRAFT_160204 [Aspergillus spectabilis]
MYRSQLRSTVIMDVQTESATVMCSSKNSRGLRDNMEQPKLCAFSVDRNAMPCHLQNLVRFETRGQLLSSAVISLLLVAWWYIGA